MANKIRRDVSPTFQITERTKIYSSYFKPTDFRKSLTGRRYLMDEAITTSLFSSSVRCSMSEDSDSPASDEISDLCLHIT